MLDTKKFVQQFKTQDQIQRSFFFDKLNTYLENILNPQYLFYFEQEELLNEARFVEGNSEAKKLEKDQYFYYFKDLAFHYFDKEPTILNEVSMTIPGTVFHSVMFFPLQLSDHRKGVLVLANPENHKVFNNKDIETLRSLRENSLSIIERIRLRNQLSRANMEIELINRINQIVDTSNVTEFFFQKLIDITQDTLDCKAIIFLTYEFDRQAYVLEAGNVAGRDFWVGQTEFFRSLAQDSEFRGVFCESYGGKHFKGEKYGLDRLETALVAPVDFYGQSRGVFILLNKDEQTNFTQLDIKLVQIICGYTKAILYRDLEKKKLISLFKRFVSDDIGENLLHTRTQDLFLEQKQEITILFMDLNGFTAFAESSEPDQVTQQLNLYFDEMTKLIVKFGGTLDKYLGDGIMALFGAPRKVFNHAERAVECALAMQERMHHINTTWLRNDLESLSASIGINTGEAMVGTVGCDQFMDFTAIGDSVNVASRLSDQARNGSILIGDTTLQSMQEVLVYKKMATVKLKGKKLEMQTYEVQALKSIDELEQAIQVANEESQINILNSLGRCLTYKPYDLSLNYIREGSLKIRQTAIETVGYLNKASHVRPLIQALNPKNETEINNKILDTICKIDIDLIRPMLDRLLNGLNKSYQRAVIQATIESKTCEDRRLLLALIKSLQDKEESKSTLIADLTNILYQDDQIKITTSLLNQLQEGSNKLKIATINALAKIQAPQIAVPLVEIFQKSSDQEVLLQCSKAIGNINDLQTLEVLTHLFQNSEKRKNWYEFLRLRKKYSPSSSFKNVLLKGDLYLKYSCLQYLLGKDNTQITELLQELLKFSPSIELKLLSIGCMKDLPNKDVLANLCSQYGHNDDLDQAILGEIGFRKSKEYMDLVLDALSNKNPMITIQSISALGRLGQPDSLSILLDVLEKAENANVTATVMQQLGAFDDPLSTEALMQALYSPIGRIRANAIESLMKLGKVEALSRIERLLSDDNNRVRANAALACLKFGKKRAFKSLVDMSQSPNKWMRLSCLWALHVSGIVESRNVIAGLLNDPDYDVIMASVNFLKKIKKSS